MKKHISIVVIIIVVMGGALMSFFNTSAPDFEQYKAGKERKDAFFNYFIPLLEQENTKISITREQLLDWNNNRDDIGWWDAQKIETIAGDYRIEDFEIEDESSWALLLKRVDVIPTSLVLAQAATESGWGTSRFSKHGNNFFGQWCFEQGCGLVPRSRGDDKTHEVAVFDTPQESVESYFQNLNSHPAYKPLRNIRQNLRTNKEPVTGIALAGGLEQYSERGTEYIDELRSIIQLNDLSKYDQK